MNAAQVKHDNYMATVAKRLEKDAAHRELLARIGDENRRAMAWSRAAFPDRVENGWPCPLAAMFAAQEKRRHPDRNPSRAVVERKVLARVRRVKDTQDPWWSRVVSGPAQQEEAA